jgi:hypothetical protein
LGAARFAGHCVGFDEGPYRVREFKYLKPARREGGGEWGSCNGYRPAVVKKF